MILITGANGQLGIQLGKFYSNEKALFATQDDLDVTNADQVELLFEKNKFSAIINCAAYTAVDLAETQQAQCYQVNSIAVEILAKQSLVHQIPMIHISTDYVFDGKTSKPYREEDRTNPLSVYGKSKLEGEQKFLEYAYSGAIIRTSWVYSEAGKNFFLTISKIMKEKKRVSVVNDQLGTPTYAFDLARAIVCILKKKPNTKETLHFSNEGVASWYDFASEISRLMNIDCEIIPITTKEYPTPALRPAYSVLDKSKIKPTLDFQIREWKEALSDFIKNKT